MKVKVQNEDEKTGYVSVKKFANRPDCYKYKLTFATVMANQASPSVARSGWVQAESDQDAMRQVAMIVAQGSLTAEGHEPEPFRRWCLDFTDVLRLQVPALA